MVNANTDTGRDPSAFFDTSAYLTNYGDIATAGVNPLLHFYNTGVYEHRDDWQVVS
jgi:serralysin